MFRFFHNYIARYDHQVNNYHEATFDGLQETKNRLFQVRGIVVKCLTSWRKTVIEICRDSNDVVAMRRNMFGRDAVASYFRWHMGISVLSTDVKLIVRTVGIMSTSSSSPLYSNNNIRTRYASVSNNSRVRHYNNITCDKFVGYNSFKLQCKKNV